MPAIPPSLRALLGKLIDYAGLYPPAARLAEAGLALQFAGDVLYWRDYGLTTSQIGAARRDFAHSFGSCSFEEPVSDLREAGLLP